VDEVEELIRGPFAELLQEHRDRLNDQIAAAKRNHPALSDDRLAAALREFAAPLYNAAAPGLKSGSLALADALFAFVPDWLASTSEEENSRLLPLLLRFLEAFQRVYIQAPAALPRHAGNVLLNLSRVNIPVELWLERMIAVAAGCAGEHAVETAGVIAAWGAGAADYRDSALRLLAESSPSVVRTLLGLNPEIEARDYPEFCRALEEHRWRKPGTYREKPGSRLELIHTIGRFRGFGGPFLNPPVVSASADGFTVSDSERSWSVTADCFGYSLHEIPFHPKPEKNGHKSCHLSRDGKLQLNDFAVTHPALVDFATFAATTDAVMVSLLHSHQLYLFGVV
jgi:hypothetical protein